MEHDSDEIIINSYYYPVYTLGPGKRFVLWTQGCNRKCLGCMSKHTWNFNEGSRFSIESIVDLIVDSRNNGCEGVTISGGEPFDQDSILMKLLNSLKKAKIEDVLVYTGYSYRDLKKKYLGSIQNIAVIIDGKFEYSKKSSLIWRGSSNQKMIILTKNERVIEKYLQFRKLRKRNVAQKIHFRDNIYIVGIPK
jgi:anaerobic ribonucleoside-triphosphate reductase activating protein